MEETQTTIEGTQLQEVFLSQDWDKLWPILQARATYKLLYTYGIRKDKEDIKEWTREIVQEILTLVFVDGTRKWNPDSYPDLKDFLLSVIDSHINNSLHKRKVEIPTADELLFEHIEVSTDGIQEEITTSELQNQIIVELKNLNADDEEMLVFECLFDGIEKPEDIRKELGITEEHFHNIWRRVKRKREKLKTKLSRYVY